MFSPQLLHAAEAGAVGNSCVAGGSRGVVSFPLPGSPRGRAFSSPATSTRASRGGTRSSFTGLQEPTPGTRRIRGGDGRTEGSQQFVEIENLLRNKFLKIWKVVRFIGAVPAWGGLSCLAAPAAVRTGDLLSASICLQMPRTLSRGMGPDPALSDSSGISTALCLWVTYVVPSWPAHGPEQRLMLPLRNVWDALSECCLVNADLLALKEKEKFSVAAWSSFR